MENKTQLITIDIGNSVFKVGANDKLIEFASMRKEIDVSEIDFAEAIIYNDKVHAIRQGDYVHENFKAKKDGLEEFVLYAISTITEADEVNLMLNLPVNQIANKELLKDRLQDKLFEFTVNSPINGISKQSKLLQISKVGVVAESMSAYYSIDDKELKDFIIVLDIGSKTVNYSTYTRIGEFDFEKSGTLDFGIHNLYGELISYYKQEQYKTYTLSDIDDRMRANRLQYPKELNVNFINKIKNSLRGNGFYDFDEYCIKACGGGAIVLGKELTEQFSEASVLDNPLYRNNIGNKIIAEGLGL